MSERTRIDGRTQTASIAVGDRCRRPNDPAGHVRTIRQIKTVSDGRIRALTAHTVDGDRYVQWVDVDRLKPLQAVQPSLFGGGA